MTLPPPPGFEAWPAKGPFIDGTARLYRGGSATAPVFGVRVEPRHCNGLGGAHGGFLSTLADVWSAYCLAPRLAASARFATASLAVEFLARAQAGDWLQSETDRVRLGRRTAVVTLAILREQRLVALSKASFALISP